MKNYYYLIMSKNSSINGNKNPFERLEAWTEGIGDNPPLIDNFLTESKSQKCKDRIIDFIRKWERESRRPRLDKINR